MKPSADYQRALELSKEQHRESKTFSGKFVRPYRQAIKSIIQRLDCKTALDYGAGKCLQYEWISPEGETLEQYWGLDVFKYDPAHPKYEAEPTGTFDIVICTHVLSLIPLPDIDWVFDRIMGFADKAVFIVTGVKSYPTKARKAAWRLPNTPQTWDADQWVEFVKRRKAKDIEIHLILLSRQPGYEGGKFVL